MTLVARNQRREASVRWRSMFQIAGITSTRNSPGRVAIGAIRRMESFEGEIVSYTYTLSKVAGDGRSGNLIPRRR
jgi:hypothetical protein